MAKTSYASVDDYLAAQPAESRRILERVRYAIRKAIPTAEETISYQIPAYKIGRVAAIYFAGWKQHFSVYPATRTLLTDLADELASYKVAKGTIRFDLADPVPSRLIGRIAKHRAAEVTATLAAKSGAAKPPRARKTSAKRAAAKKTRSKRGNP